MVKSQVTDLKTDSHVRIRTCIALKNRYPDSQLLRIVARTDSHGQVTIVPDPKRRLPGRGAWITPDVDAWELAQRRQAFGRALKVSAKADASSVKHYLAQLAAPESQVATPVPAIVVGGADDDDKRKT